MTDKEKIRKKVVEIVNSINPFIPDEDGKNSDYESGRLAMATQILQYIDSLPQQIDEGDVVQIDKLADVKSLLNELRQKSDEIDELSKNKRNYDRLE